MTDTWETTDIGTDGQSTDAWAEWPESDLEIDDEAFAEAIARGRTFEAAA